MKLNKNLFTSLSFFVVLMQSTLAMYNKERETLEVRLHSYMQQSPQELYHFALELRDGKIPEFNIAETKEAAYQCFYEVFRLTAQIQEEDSESKVLWGKAAHNLGTILYGQGKYQEATKMYIIGASTGLQASKNNLTKLQALSVLPKAIKADPILAQDIHNQQADLACKTNDTVRLMEEVEESLIQEISEVFSSTLGLNSTLKKQIQTVWKKNSHQHKKQAKAMDQDFYSQVSHILSLQQQLKNQALNEGLQPAHLDQFTYDSLKDRKFTPSEIKESLFPLSVLAENDKVAKAIKEMLLPLTLPIFIGRSCEWIMEHFQQRFPAQTFVKLPGSGLYNMVRFNDELKLIAPGEDRQHYTDFLKSFNLSRSVFEDKQYTSITLIDRTESGDSIRVIANLLKNIDPRFDDQRVHFIGIIDQNNSQSFKFPTIVVSDTALAHTIKKHNFDQASARSQPFHGLHWKNWRTFNFYPKPLAPAQARLDQVERFVKENP